MSGMRRFDTMTKDGWKRHRTATFGIAVAMLALLAPGAQAHARFDVIDMHFHADRPDDEGPPGGKACAPYPEWAPRDPGKPIDAYVD